jgi:hypothetical protein
MRNFNAVKVTNSLNSGYTVGLTLMLLIPDVFCATTCIFKAIHLYLRYRSPGAELNRVLNEVKWEAESLSG